MSKFLNPLGRCRPDGFAGRMAEIKGWTRAVLGLDGDMVVSVNELACGQAGCPPRQTMILVFTPSAPARKFAIHKAMLEVGEADVTAALHGDAGDG